MRIRSIRVVHVHHLDDALRDEHLGGICRPGNEQFELGTFADGFVEITGDVAEGAEVVVP